MPNYFTAAPIDLGANITARGYENFSNSILGAMKQVGEQKAQEQQLNLQSALEEQKRQTQLEQQVKMEAGQYGVSPIIDQDTGKLNLYATMAANQRAKDIHERAQAMAGYKDRSDFQDQSAAEELGLNGKKPGMPTPFSYKMPQLNSNPGLMAGTQAGAPIGGTSFSSPVAPATADAAPAPDAPPAEPLGRQIYLAKEAEKQKEFERQRKIAAEASAAGALTTRRANQVDAFRMAIGREPNADELDPQGNLSAPALKAMNDAKQASSLTPTQRNAKASVDAGIKAGYIKPEDADQAAAMFEASGGRAPQMPLSLRDQVDADTRVITGLKPLEDKIATYDKSKFGPVSFRAATVAGGLLGSKDSQDARAIEQAYNKVSSGEAFAMGGKTLTPTEKDAIISQIGKPTDADFANRISQYHDSKMRDAQIHLEQLEQSPHRFTAEGQAAIKKLQNLLGGSVPSEPAATAQPLQIMSVKRVK